MRSLQELQILKLKYSDMSTGVILLRPPSLLHVIKQTTAQDQYMVQLLICGL